MAVELLTMAAAPDVGAAKVTVTFGTGLLYLSSTTTASGLVKGWPSVVDWGEPEITATDAAAPGVLVRLKLAAVVTPETEAVTL